MRIFLSILIVLGAVTWFVAEKVGVFEARGASILSFLSDGRAQESRFDGNREEKLLPLVTESREQAATFQPVPKTSASGFAVPTAHASAILDTESGRLLYEHNADDRRQIASLTKIFTATIVMERVKDLSEPVTIDEESVYVEGTRIGCPRSGFCNGERLKVGEKVAVRDLLKAALMNSANDAATALGKHLGGTVDGFAQIMNDRARELGLENSHFCTPSGLEPDGREHECYSSARDVARITAEALKHDILWDMMRMEKHNIYSVDGRYSHEIFNTDELLGQLPNLIGTKTGFTPLAGRSLLAVAVDPSREHKIVAVVLDDQYRWESVRSMFNWSFTSFDWK